MAIYSFRRWRLLKESAEGVEKQLPVGFDPFTTLQQKQGEVVYFGVHDLSKFYRANGSLPKLDIGQIQMKSGQVINADPVDQLVTVSAPKQPYHLGYHKLEGDNKGKQNPETGQYEVQIPVTSLQDVTSLFGDEGQKVWLVVDGNTKYQKGLLRAIRKKEIERAHAGAAGDGMGGMDPSQMGGEEDMGQMGGMDPNMMGQMGGEEDMGQTGGMGGMDANMMGQMGGMDPNMGGMDPSQMGQMGGMGQQPQQQPQQQPLKPKFKLQGRNVIPMGGQMNQNQPQLDVAHHDIMSYNWFWKRHNDRKYYPYLPD